MEKFFYKHFGDDVPLAIEKEYNRLLIQEYNQDLREQKNRVQTINFDEVTEFFPDPATLPTFEYTPDAIMARALQLADQKLELVKQQNGQLTETSIAQAKQIEEMQPKVSYYGIVLNSAGLMPINTIAKDYGKSAIWLNRWLHEHGIQYKQGAVWHLYQQYAGMGYVSSRTYAVYDSNGNSISKARTYWTQRGRLFIYEQLKKHGILPLIEQNNG